MMPSLHLSLMYGSNHGIMTTTTNKQQSFYCVFRVYRVVEGKSMMIPAKVADFKMATFPAGRCDVSDTAVKRTRMRDHKVSLRFVPPRDPNVLIEMSKH